MREREHFQSSDKTTSLPKSKVFVVIAIFLLATFGFAQENPIHLLYTHGAITTIDNTQYYEFDVQAYMTEAGDVIGDGMIYVEYPLDVFNGAVVYNQKVSVVKSGILADTDPIINGELYRLVNITDTKMNMFAVTFSSTYQSTDLKPYYSAISSDPSNPSDLLHITIEIANLASSSVIFPSTIPDYQLLYYNYEGDCFPGLDISEAVEIVYETPVIEDPVGEPGEDPIDDPTEDPLPDPAFVGQVELNSFTANLKKSIVTLNWSTSSESDISEYIVQRSDNGLDFSEIAHINAVEITKKFNKYQFADKTTISEIIYSYRLDTVDTEGNIRSLSTTGIATKPGRKNVNYFLENDEFALEASYPNPFNPSFTVPFTISRAQEIDIKLYDMSGKIVANIANGYHSAGNYKINVDCNHLGSGVYLLRTLVNNNQSTQKMLLVK